MQPNGVQGLRPQQVVLCRGVSMVNSKAFPTVLSLVTALVLFAVLGTALAAPDTRWQGTASDNVKVYIDPSSASRMVTILTRGVHVTILVEIEALGIQWCHVQLAGEKSTSSNFNTSPNALQQAKTNGVADSVILAMVQAPIPTSEPVAIQPATTNLTARPSPTSTPSPVVPVLRTSDISTETFSTKVATNSKDMIKVEIVQQT